MFKIGWVKKSGNQFFLRIILVIVVSLMISGIVYMASSFVMRQLSVRRFEEKREAEELEVTALVNEVKALIQKQRLTYSEVVDQNLAALIEGYDVYVSGVDGRIYLEGREEGVSINDLALSMNTLYIYSAEFSDGNGYFIVKSGIEGKSWRNNRLYSLLFSNIIFIICAFFMIRKQLQKYSIDPADRNAMPGDAAEAEGQKTENHEPETLAYTDMYVVLQQFIGELDWNVELKGQEGPIYIAGDIDKFVQVLIRLAGKIEEVVDESSRMILDVIADEHTASLDFSVGVLTEQRSELFSEDDYRYVRERMIPINGNLKALFDKGMWNIRLSFARR